MANKIQSVPLGKLIPHPDNPNRISKANFARLVRNIKRTGRYEPLIVRPHPEKNSFFQIINGHHRWQALRELGYKTADVIVWDVDDGQTDILLATLNRLGGSDVLAKKIALLNRLSRQMPPAELAKLLPRRKKQIEQLASLTGLRNSSIELKELDFANPLVFFATDRQQRIIETALTFALQKWPVICAQAPTKAARRAAALAHIAKHFLSNPNS